MIFAPVRLGETSLNAEAVAADKKSCKRFGPCGVGKEALFLNSYFIDRRYYVAFSSVRRVFKHVAMSQGGFSGQGVFGAIPISWCSMTAGRKSSVPSSARKTWTRCSPISGKCIPRSRR